MQLLRHCPRHESWCQAAKVTSATAVLDPTSTSGHEHVHGAGAIPSAGNMAPIHLLVCRAKGDGNSSLVHAVRAFAVRGEGTAAAGGIKEAGVDLAVTGQAGEDSGPLLEGVGQDLHDLDAGHVPPRLHSLRYLHSINPVTASTSQLLAHTLLCPLRAFPAQL